MPGGWQTRQAAPSAIVADVRILHIAWEYPPLVFGGLGRHVGALARAQARAGNDVVVITRAEGPASLSTTDGVRIIRVPRDGPAEEVNTENLLPWVDSLEDAMSNAVTSLAQSDWRPDVVHGHDWMVARTLSQAQRDFRIPVVATFHATEAGRHQGWLPNDLSKTIHRTEWWLAHQATRVIACSSHMRWEVCTLFEIPERVVSVIPNGIDLADWTTTPAERHRARQQFASDGPLVVFAGRLEWEKGVHTLLEATPAVAALTPGVRVVIAGRGGKADELERLADRLELGSTATFTGWLPENDLHALVAAADIAVVPSLYEPFGLVALEAAALGTPVVVARTGGLAEIAAGGRVAATFTAGDPVALAQTLRAAIADPVRTRRMVEQGALELERTYNWDHIAAMTVRTYESAVSSWDGSVVPPRTDESLRDGNLLTAAPPS